MNSRIFVLVVVCCSLLLTGAARPEKPGVSQTSAAAGGFEVLGGNTDFEELVALGFDAQNRSIVGVISVKLPGGYDNNHVMGCWADWNGDLDFTATNEYLGTVTRYTPNPGATNLPVFFGLSLPVSVPPSVQLGVSYEVRCVMTWTELPTGPSFIPVWGNALQGFVLFDDIL